MSQSNQAGKGPVQERENYAPFWRKDRLRLLALGFAHGVLACAFVAFALSARFEDGIYDQLVARTVTIGMSQEQKLLKLMHVAHDLVSPRLELFRGQDYVGVRDTWFRSGDVQLIDGRGACGSYTHVFARLLERAKIPVRIAQMRCGDHWGCHILLEASIDGEWAVADALYEAVFRRPDGRLASFAQVSADWSNYTPQLPPGYDTGFAFEGVRYTNWNSIPVLMPVAKHVLGWLLGSGVETLSLRALVLNRYRAFAQATAFTWALLGLWSFVRFRRRATAR